MLNDNCEAQGDLKFSVYGTNFWNNTIMNTDPSKLASKGKKAFSKKNYEQAAEYFEQAAQGFTEGRAGLLAAEMKNNLSVALLQAGKAQEALEAAQGTDVIFEGAKDTQKQAMALSNLGAAFEALNQYDEALTAYEKASSLFGSIDEHEMRSMVIKSAAAVKLKTGKITDAAYKMIGAVETTEKPTFFQRIAKFLLRITR